MIKLNKNLFLIVALVGGTIGFTGCNSTPTNTTNGNTATVTNTKPAGNTTTTSTTTETKTETASGDKIGVAECDEYITKYEACINSKVPEAQRAMLKGSFEAQRKAFKDAAATPQGKAGLATGCKQAIETAKQSTAAWSCAW